MTTRCRAVLLALSALALGAPGAAGALELTTQQISGRSPFHGNCGSSGNGMFTRNSAVEPDIEADPARPGHVVAAWIQDDGSAISTSTSTDGGRTWRRTVVPGLTRCTGGKLPAVADPWLSFGSDHRLYLASGAGDIVPDPALPGGYRIVTEQFVSRSAGTGLSWSRPAVSQPLNGTRWDKQTVTADPNNPSRAYAVFCGRPADPANGGTLYLSRTLDGGRHWSPRRALYRAAPGGGDPFSNGGVVIRGSTVVLAFALQNTDTGSSVRMMTIRSTDGGHTWRRAVRVATVSGTFATASGPEPIAAPRHPFVGLVLLPAIAADRRGTVYLAWANLRRTGRSTIELARSSDGGGAWRRLRPIVRTRAQPFGPRLAIAHDGTLGVSYYEARRAGVRARWPASVLFAYSRDAAGSWHVTHLAGPTNLLSAERPGGGRDIRIGDYFGLTAAGAGFLAAYVLAGPQTAVAPQGVFVTRIGLGRRSGGNG